MNVLYLLVFITLTEARQNDWVDPHEMKINVKKKMGRSFSENDKSSDLPKEYVINNAPSVDENMSLIYLKRSINLILNSANRDSDNPNVYIGSYKYTTDSEEYKFLTEFTNSEKTNNEDIRRLDTVLSTIFSTSYQNDMSNFVTGLKEQISNVYFLILLGIIICLYVVYLFLKSNSGIWCIISYFLCLLLIVDYGFRYRVMYEDAEEHNMKVTYTTDCDTTKMSWSQYFKFVVSSKDCEKKMVTPLEVGLNQLKHVIIIPLESVGTGMGKLGKELWQNLPAPWNILIFPIMLVFILLISFVFVLALKDSRFRLKLFHLLDFEFGKKENNENRIKGETLDKLLEATICKRIEDTRSSPVKTQPKRIKNKDKTNKNKQKQPEKSVDDNTSDKTENTSTGDCSENKKEK